MSKSVPNPIFVLIAIIFIVLALVLNACARTPQTTQLAPPREDDSSGIASPTPSPTMTPIPLPTPTIDLLILIQEATLIETDFESGTHFGVQDWENKWEMRQTPDGNTSYCNLPMDEWESFTIGEESWSDYAFEVDIQLVSDTSEYGYELYARLGQAGGYRATVYKGRAGMNFYPPFIDFGGDSISIQPGEWHTYRVEAVNDTFRYFVDDKLFVEVEDGRQASGQAGVGASPGTEICVDNIRMWAIDENGPVALDIVPGVIGSDEVDQSKYFEKIELLESASIPLTVGDLDYFIRSSAIHDMDEDGNADVVLTIATYPENRPHPIVVLNGDGPVENIAKDIFSYGIPEIRHSNQILFVDIDNDKRKDLLISEAGLDHSPWYTPDALIGIAMNRGGGIFEDVSAKVPQKAKGLRNYSLAAGDLYNDGINRIILPSQTTAEGIQGPKMTGLLFWNGSEFEFQQNWIDMSLWWAPENLYSSSFMSVQDIDGDGWQDLYISGSWVTPNHRVLYGSDTFPSKEFLYTLPEGPYGHTPWESFAQPNVDFARGSDVNQVVFEDFDGDGDLDLVSVMEDVQNYKPGVFEDVDHPWYTDVHENGGTIYGNVCFQVLRNDGERQFVDVTTQGKDLGYRYYIALLPIDIDLDGDMDLIGQYWNKSPAEECEPGWGSTILINDGNLVFSKVEAEEVFPELSAVVGQVPWASGCNTLGLGAFFPTVISTNGIKGLFVAPIDFNPDEPELRVLRFQATGRFHVTD